MRKYAELRALNATGTRGFTIPIKMFKEHGLKEGNFYKIDITSNQIIFTLVAQGD